MSERRAPQGARGLKPDIHIYEYPLRCRRAPQGARGLKHCSMPGGDVVMGVAPPRGRVD